MLKACAVLGAVAAVLAGSLDAPAQDGQQDYFEDAVKSYRAHELEHALVALKNALQADPDNVAALTLIGRIYTDLGDGAAARQALERARQEGADDGSSLILLARSYLLSGDHDLLLREIRSGGRSPHLNICS